tara:strand:+ start:183 stop:482 length:300 start_codon:yes stop_codon:yes gene_type:complete
MNIQNFIKLCKVEDIKNDRKTFELDDKKFFLIKDKENYYFMEAVCKHMGGPLEKGKIKDNTIECPWHGCKFDFKTGKSPNSSHKLIVREVIVKDGYIYV